MKDTKAEDPLHSIRLAKLIGPVLILMTASEIKNIHIWEHINTINVYQNGTMLFVAGLAIIGNHNKWTRSWETVITLTGWFAISLGLMRMFFPELQVALSTNASSISPIAIVVMCVGIFLTVMAYTRKGN